MPQKRMAARGQSAKLAKGPSLKKAPLKTGDVRSKTAAVKPKAILQKPKVNGEKPKTSGEKTKELATKNLANKAKAVKAAKEVRPPAQIEKAKAALKSATGAKAKAPADEAAPAEVKTTVSGQPKAKAGKAPKAEGKRSRKISIDINPNEAASALSGKWSTLYKKAEQIEAKPYNMKAVFEEKTAITHKVLGWGYILANRNDRLEVLFKDGIKYLISNYKT